MIIHHILDDYRALIKVWNLNKKNEIFSLLCISQYKQFEQNFTEKNINKKYIWILITCFCALNAYLILFLFLAVPQDGYVTYMQPIQCTFGINFCHRLLPVQRKEC